MNDNSFVVQTTTNVNEASVTFAGFNKVALLIEANATIDVVTRYKKYATIEEIEVDFATTTIEYKKSLAFFDQDVKPSELYLLAIDVAAETFSEVLGDFITKKGGAYFIATTLSDEAKLKEIAQAIEVSSTKMRLTISSDAANILDAAITVDIASSIKASQFKRTNVLYHETANEYFDMKLLGRIYSTVEGESWDNRVMKGLTTDNLSTSHINSLVAKNCGFLINIDDDAWSKNIISGNDWFADIVRGIDYVDMAMDLEIIAMIKDKDVPKDNKTMAQIKAAVTKVMNESVVRNIVDADTLEINVPLASELNDGRDIVLNNLYVFDYLHSMHKITVSGTVTI
jgi:hypothetical protein